MSDSEASKTPDLRSEMISAKALTDQDDDRLETLARGTGKTPHDLIDQFHRDVDLAARDLATAIASKLLQSFSDNLGSVGVLADQSHEFQRNLRMLSDLPTRVVMLKSSNDPCKYEILRDMVEQRWALEREPRC